MLYDGLFYVNGYLYIGYVLNKIIKDMIVCSYQMMGCDV